MIDTNKTNLTLAALATQDNRYFILHAHIKEDFFSEEHEKDICFVLKQYYTEFGKPAPKEAAYLIIQDKINSNQKQLEAAVELLSDIYLDDYSKLLSTDFDFCFSTIEKWAQDQALYVAVSEAVAIYRGDSTRSRGELPSLLTNALSLTFNPSIGMDYLEDYERRYEFYHENIERVPTYLREMDESTNGGPPKKSLTVLVAGTGVGKSTTMCALAANQLLHGHNVLYITCEMSEEQILQRIDMNLLDATQDELTSMNKDSYTRRISGIINSSTGKLIAKGYPMGVCTANHIRALLNDLKMKKGFEPDIVYIDYLNILASSHVKNRGDLYAYNKSIAEEIRSIAQERNFPIVTATQSNRTGQDMEDPQLKEVSESHGVAATADLMAFLICTESMEKMNQLKIKEVKNRFGRRHNTYTVGLQRDKMRLYNLEATSYTSFNNYNHQYEPAKTTSGGWH